MQQMPSGASILDGHHHLCDTNGVRHFPWFPHAPPPSTESASVFGQMSHLSGDFTAGKGIAALNATDYEAAEDVCKEGVLHTKCDLPGFCPINVYLYMQTASYLQHSRFSLLL
jgi:hypothetical protein